MENSSGGNTKKATVDADSASSLNTETEQESSNGLHSGKRARLEASQAYTEQDPSSGLHSGQQRGGRDESSYTDEASANEGSETKYLHDIIAKALEAFFDPNSSNEKTFLAVFEDGTTGAALRGIQGLSITTFIPELEGRIPPRAVITVDRVTLEEIGRSYQGVLFKALRPIDFYLIQKD